ncbi:hypothetical protein WME98_10375 [Sorangium sp. So ce296]|uniref:hypothetical protein n=1 Tax=Sorangium sp. So ce296 TaxID=3133296 RepID=UPI003F61C7D1
MLVERDTGIVLNQAGHKHLRGQPAYRPAFDSLADALALKDDLLVLFPWAEVVLTDSEADPSTRTCTFYPSSRAEAEFRRLKQQYFAYRFASPLRRVFMSLPLDPWSPTSYWPLRSRGAFPDVTAD